MVSRSRHLFLFIVTLHTKIWFFVLLHSHYCTPAWYMTLMIYLYHKGYVILVNLLAVWTNFVGTLICIAGIAYCINATPSVMCIRKRRNHIVSLFEAYVHCRITASVICEYKIQNLFLEPGTLFAENKNERAVQKMILRKYTYYSKGNILFNSITIMILLSWYSWK